MAKLKDDVFLAPPDPAPFVPYRMTAADLGQLEGIGDPTLREAQDAAAGFAQPPRIVQTAHRRVSEGDVVEV